MGWGNVDGEIPKSTASIQKQFVLLNHNTLWLVFVLLLSGKMLYIKIVNSNHDYTF
jgi:hypothetical protein